MKPRLYLYIAICLIVAGFGLLLFANQNQNNIQEHRSDKASITVINLKTKKDTTSWKKYLGFIFIGVGLVIAASNLRLKTQKENSKINFTKKEQEIVDAIRNGMSNKEIAKTQFISLSTIKTHTSNIYKKVGVNSRDELIEKLKIIGTST